MARRAEEHEALMAEIGGAARALVQEKGWIN
jgi:hypothetical protein